MDQTKSEYEFLDLSDINEEERSSLASALFPASHQPPLPGKAEAPPAWVETHYVGEETMVEPVYLLHPTHIVDLSSCSSDTAGPPTASSSLDSLDMPPPAPASPPAPRGPYSQPPPAALYGAAPQWTPSLMPPNVYVSQVTANVNVHGYMSQYYQSPQHTYNTEPRGRDSRMKRRGGLNKRAPSPPYVYYPQYYPSAQGAPLYHMPMYPPVGYMPQYPYPYMDYPMPPMGLVDEQQQSDKGPEEYLPEMMMEHEHIPHEMYYQQHQPAYDGHHEPCSLEPYPAYYAPPPQPPPSTHQFNVHAKNFVRQSDHKPYNPPPIEHKQESATLPPLPPPKVTQPSNVVPLMKELKINPNNNKSVPSPKHQQEKHNLQQTTVPQPPIKTPVILTNDKVAPKPPTEAAKPAWSVNNAKPAEVPAAKPAPPPATPLVSQPLATPVAKPPPTIVPTPPTGIPNKLNKSPVPAPFTNMKTIVKSAPSPAGVIVQHQTLPAKAPFAIKPKKEATIKPQDAIQVTNEVVEPAPAVSPVASAPPQTTPVPEMKPALPAPVVKPNPPVAIAPAAIVSKAPFSHARKPSITAAEVPTPVAVAPPPTASDFPPPPAPRRAAPEQTAPTTQSQPAAITPSPVRSWASLFGSNKAAAAAATVAPPEEKPIVNSVAPAPLVNNTLPASVNVVNQPNQKPVAKVLPFDASPLQWEGGEKVPSGTGSAISYSEKTSNGQLQKAPAPLKEEPALGSSQTQVPPHINDPNSYRMGEFLSKYQLNHHTVSLQPRGLSNRSNYCYINAILQALIACPPFYNMLRSLPHQPRRGKSATPIIDAMVELINEFTVLPPGAGSRSRERGGRGGSGEAFGSCRAGPPLEPAPVLRALRDVQAGGDSFRVDGRQEDAEEFLGCLLNGLNDEMLELIKLVEPEESKDIPAVPNGNDVAMDSDDDVEWKVIGPKNKGSVERRCLAGRTPLSDIFRGQLRSRLQCLPAPDAPQPEPTHCVQPFFTLPLDIEKSASVREALEKVAGRERMEGVRCRERGRPVDAWSQSLLERLPYALLLHLKCFHCRPQDNATAKIVKTIEYPIDLKIDPKIITPKMKYNPKQRSYKLFAVVYHEGAELEKGHYMADAYHAGSGGWLRYDDSVVTPVTEQQVLQPRLPRTPYLLLYRRQDTMQARHPAPN